MPHLPLTICLIDFLAIAFPKVLQLEKKLYFSLLKKLNVLSAAQFSPLKNTDE